MSAALEPLLQALAAGPLAPAEAEAAFALVLDGAAAPDEVRRFLQLSASRLYDPGFLVAGAQAMRARMRSAWAPEGAIDVCGTGGDGANTVNVSTAVAFVVAGAGVPVAKHGNRAASSRSGAADVLQALGVQLDLDPRASFEAAGLAFLFAPNHHPTLAPLAPIRRELGVRTVFNVLGPLCNPAGVKRQLVGASETRLLEPMAEALRQLGAERALLICGERGVDEITPYGQSEVVQLRDGVVEPAVPAFLFMDSSYGPADLQGGGPEENAAALLRVLTGEDKGAYRAAVQLNAAAALMLTGADSDDGLAAASDAIDSGAALQVLRRLQQASQ